MSCSYGQVKLPQGSEGKNQRRKRRKPDGTSAARRLRAAPIFGTFPVCVAFFLRRAQESGQEVRVPIHEGVSSLFVSLCLSPS